MIQIQGTVENIVFKNEENGYVVATLKHDNSKTTIVGIIPFVTEGQTISVEGKYASHPKFGQQLKVEAVEEVIPNSIVGIEKYLACGTIAGIGPVTARKIVQHFKEDTLEILDNDIDRLKEIDGIGKKKINVIKESYIKNRGMRKIMIFFQGYGLTPGQCNKIFKKYGDNSIEVVKNNPYILTEEISGVGFKTADKIAMSLGIEVNSPFRIKSGINYVLSKFCFLGNTYMPIDKLLQEGSDILTVSKDEVEKNLFDSAMDLKVKIETFNEKVCVFPIMNHYSEMSVTYKLITLASAGYDQIKIDVEKEIESFEKENNITFAESQKEAIRGAILNGIEVITGGPGTGKTTIINCILSIFNKASMKVFMAAPTGRAAKRMTEATGCEAKTIHRLLELGVSEDDEIINFSKSEETPLQCDVLICDEASMIDINLMNNLLKAVPIGTRVIIVGDVDQLPSVGPGNVLRDIIESNAVKVVRLKEIFRQGKESMIVVNAHKINNGEMPDLNVRDKDFFFIKKDDEREVINEIIGLVDKRLINFNRGWEKIKHIQILTPMRKGTLGVESLNKSLQDVLNPHNINKKEIEYKDIVFRVGDKVIQTKNNYLLKYIGVNGKDEILGEGVFNGDIGYIYDIDEEKNKLKILYDEEKIVEYEDMYFDEIELAYAMTIHKSQGSEFPVVILPMYMGAPMLMNRNLLYTGITRAKQLVVLVGNIKALNYMVNNTKSAERYSALKERIIQVIE